MYTDGVVVVDKHNINSHDGVALNTRKINMAMAPIYLTGICDYASITKPNTRFEHVWEIDIRLDDDTKALVEGVGAKVLYKEDRGEYVKCKRKTENKNGPTKAPTVVDSQNNPWDDKLIGNGSLVKVKALPFNWNFAGKTGISLDLDKVQVIELVPYGDQSEDFDIVEGGYVNEAAASEMSDDIPFGN